MNVSMKNILWIDDEINHFKSHVLFLEKKGYRSPLYDSFPTTVTDFIEKRKIPEQHDYEISHLCLLNAEFVGKIDRHFKSDLRLC